METTFRRTLVAPGRNRPAERGGALVMALIGVIAVMGLSMGFAQLASGLTKRQRHSVGNRHAFYLAESGLAEAYTGLAVARTGNVGSPERPARFGGGLFWVEAEPVGTDRIELESTGMWGDGRATLSMVVEPVHESVATQGFFASNDIQVEPGMLIDSFDSRAGPYAAQAAAGLNGGTRIASNGDISISGGAAGTVIAGDVVHGPAGTMTTAGDVTVTGTVGPAGAEVVLPPVEFPGMPMAGDIDHTAEAPLVIAPGDTGLASLLVKTSAVVVGPARLEVGTLTLASGAELQIDSSAGPVEIFVHDEVLFSSGSTVVTTNLDPTGLSLQIGPGRRRGNNATLSANAVFYGMIYAPQSELYLSSGFEVFGSAAAATLRLSQGGALHFDAGGALGAALLPQLHSWRVVEIPAVARGGADPFATLGVSAADCPPPATAHEDQQLELTYVGLDGIQRTYSGWESAFDWTQVASVLSGSRDGTAFRPPAEWTESANDPSEPASEEPVSPEDQALLDWLNDLSLTSREIKRELLNKTPLSDAVIRATVTRSVPLDHTDLKQVLLRNSPMSEDLVLLTIDEPDFHTGSLKYVLLENSPLSAAELQATLDRDPPLSATDLAEVLAAQ